MAYLAVEGLNKGFVRAAGGEIVSVVKTLSLGVGEGEIMALLGASGSGKTTLLRCVAGLETPDAGEIAVAGQRMFSSVRGINVPPHKRNMGMVFQSYALWPHMSVSQNVAYPLVRRGVPAGEIAGKVKSYLGLVNCLEFADRFPHQLSGGQQQRIALARALVAEPSLVLFDEPLSSLDANLREELRFQIREIKRRVTFTGLYVTHDHSEALFIADRIAIIGDGRVLQVGASAELYDLPSSAEVADFLGFTNTLEGTVESAGAVLQFRSEIGPIALPPEVPAGMPRPVGRALLKCHPSRVEFRPDHAGDGALPGTIIDLVRAAPDSLQYVVELAPGIVWQCWGSTAERFRIGDRVRLRPSPDHLHLFGE